MFNFPKKSNKNINYLDKLMKEEGVKRPLDLSKVNDVDTLLAMFGYSINSDVLKQYKLIENPRKMISYSKFYEESYSNPFKDKKIREEPPTNEQLRKKFDAMEEIDYLKSKVRTAKGTEPDVYDYMVSFRQSAKNAGSRLAKNRRKYLRELRSLEAAYDDNKIYLDENRKKMTKRMNKNRALAKGTGALIAGLGTELVQSFFGMGGNYINDAFAALVGSEATGQIIDTVYNKRSLNLKKSLKEDKDKTYAEWRLNDMVIYIHTLLETVGELDEKIPGSVTKIGDHKRNKKRINKMKKKYLQKKLF